MTVFLCHPVPTLEYRVTSKQTLCMLENFTKLYTAVHCN